MDPRVESGGVSWKRECREVPVSADPDATARSTFWACSGMVRAGATRMHAHKCRNETMPRIFVDADGCPVKQDICRIAERYGLQVTFVANTEMSIPHRDRIELIVVSAEFDAADNYIVSRVATNDIVITDDIPLAARCLQQNARVLSTRGKRFSHESIGEALATRELMTELRAMGTVTGGPALFGKRDRSNFLERLDETINAARKAT